MVPVRLVLAARDEQYIEPFLHYVRHSEFDRRFSVTAFSREDAFVRHMESSRLYADAVLAEKPFLEAWLGGGETPQVPYIHLEEGTAKGYGKSISKYQPLPLLLTAVLEYARGGAAAREPVEGKALVVGVYSAVGGCGKTTVAAHLVKQLAGEGRKVFYLNLETISSGIISENPSIQEGQHRTHGLARLLYDLKAAGERGEPINQPVSSYAYRHPVLEGDTFGPVDNLNEMLEMESGDTARLIDFIADSGLYDVIVADADSYPNARTETVLDRADKLVWLLADEESAVRKSGLWISHMERSNPERFRLIMGKALFVVNRCMGEAEPLLPRPGMTAEITLPNIPSWNQGAGQGTILQSPVFQKEVLKLSRSLYSWCHALGIGGDFGVTEDFFTELRASIRSGLDMTSTLSDSQLMDYIERRVLADSGLYELTASEKRKWVRRLYDSFRGLDVLQPLVDDRSVSEIMINSHEEIFIEQNGQVRRIDVRFESQEKLEDMIQNIVSTVNRVVNDSSPIVDARLPGGSRVNIVLPPIALKGPTMTIRKFPEQPVTMERLVEWGSLTEEAALFLQGLVKGKYNIFISGGTGSGKTTFLNALSQYIPPDERVITIEDSAELRIVTVPNLVSLETRNANTEGKGEISVRDLIRASLRMRPNRIIVGEVRGSETIDMLQAMNTGHDGSLSTGHANSTKDMISRLETMVLSGAALPVQVVRQQIGSAIDIFVHLSRLRDRSRRVMEISEVCGLVEGEVMLNPLFVFQEEAEVEGKIRGRLIKRSSLANLDKLRMAGIDLEQELEQAKTAGGGNA